MDIIDGFFLARKLKNFEFTAVPDLSASRQMYETDFIWNLLNHNDHNSYHADVSLKHVLIARKDEQPARVPITELYGSHHGTSNIHNSTEDFANHLMVYPRGHANNSIYFENDDDFAKNIRSIEERYTKPYEINHYQWNGKKFLKNQDQSHHVAAVYRQCREQNRNYGINSFTTRCSIDKQALAAFDKVWQIYAVVPSPNSREYFISHMLKYQDTQRQIHIPHLDIDMFVLFIQKNKTLTKSLLSFLGTLEAEGKSADVSRLLLHGANQRFPIN